MKSIQKLIDKYEKALERIENPPVIPNLNGTFEISEEHAAEDRASIFAIKSFIEDLRNI